MKYRKDIEKLIEDIQGVASKAAKDAKSEILKQAQDPNVLLKAAQVAGEAQKNIQTFGDKPVQEWIRQLSGVDHERKQWRKNQRFVARESRR